MAAFAACRRAGLFRADPFTTLAAFGRLAPAAPANYSSSSSSSSFWSSSHIDSRQISQLVQSNGKRLFLVHTLALVRRLEAQGEAITSSITEVLNDSLENVAQSFVSRSEMQIDQEQMCDPLISLGAKYGSSPEEVTASCDVTFAMLADLGSAVDVACGKQGAVNGMSPGKGYVDVSTVDGETSKLINSHIKETGALFLEVVSQGAISAPMLSMKGPSMVQSKYPTAFPLKQQQKDMRLALGLAESVNQPTPVAIAQILIYDLRSSSPLRVEDHKHGSPILNIKWHKTLKSIRHQVFEWLNSINSIIRHQVLE